MDQTCTILHTNINQTQIFLFLPVTLTSPKMTFVKAHGTSLGHTQTLCEVGTSNVFFCKNDINWTQI